MKENELRIGNYIQWMEFEEARIMNHRDFSIICESLLNNNCDNVQPIPLTEEWLQKFGFSVINESSAGKKYGYVINGIFNSDLTFTFWKTTKEVGKFFRGDLELKSVHQLQNLYFALTGAELTVA